MTQNGSIRGPAIADPIVPLPAPSDAPSRMSPRSSFINIVCGRENTAATDAPKGVAPCSRDDLQYRLKFRQQPVAARSCQFGDKYRRCIDPPPIVQLTLENPYLTPAEIGEHLRSGRFILTCSIYDESGTVDTSIVPSYPRKRQLVGSQAESSFIGQDENGKEGCFFCFSDLSCRMQGRFRLKFSLVDLSFPSAVCQTRLPTLVEAVSDVFTVYNAKDFPGTQSSTELVRCLRDQGYMIPLKWGNGRPTKSDGLEDMSDHESNDGNAPPV